VLYTKQVRWEIKRLFRITYLVLTYIHPVIFVPKIAGIRLLLKLSLKVWW